MGGQLMVGWPEEPTFLTRHYYRSLVVLECASLYVRDDGYVEINDFITFFTDFHLN